MTFRHPLLRSAVGSLDSNLAIYEVSTLHRVMQRQTWFYTVFGTFFMAFGFCALFLAVVLSLTWCLMASLTPAADRPWISGTSDNSIHRLPTTRPAIRWAGRTRQVG